MLPFEESRKKNELGDDMDAISQFAHIPLG